MIDLLILGLFAFSMLSIYISYVLANKRVVELGGALMEHIKSKNDKTGAYVSLVDYSIDLKNIQKAIDGLSDRIYTHAHKE